MQLRRQQSKRGDRWKVHTILHRHELRFTLHLKIDCRIDLLHVQLFVNPLRPDIVPWSNSRRDFVPGRLSHHHANGLFAAAKHSWCEFDFWSFAAFESKWIMR